jgi:dTDP-glucose 4,6-dehydratase
VKTILVTGAAGFIGSCLVRMTLAEKCVRVVSLDRLTYAGNLLSLAGVMDDPAHSFVRGDVCDRAVLDEVLRLYRPQVVVHLAAETHVDRSIDGPREFLRSNTVGTFELLAACLSYFDSLPGQQREEFRFLQVSSDEVYGSLGPEGAFSESSPCDPSSPYSASKAAADHFARAFYRTYGLPVLLTRCSNNYGPYQFPEKLIPLVTLNALAGRPLPVYGDGRQRRDWLFVEDHCRALWAVLLRGRPGEVYNIGGGAERSNLQVIHAVCTAVDKLSPQGNAAPCSSLIRFVEDRPGHDRRYAVDSTKLRSELGWAPQVAFEEGLPRTVAWYVNNPGWVEAVSLGQERGQRLGLSGRKS